MMKNKTLLASVIMVAVGIVLELIGSFAFGSSTGVGVNLNALSNPIVLIGIVVVILTTIYTLIVKIISAMKKEGDSVLTLALEIAITGLLFSVVFMVLFATYPLLVNL